MLDTWRFRVVLLAALLVCSDRIRCFSQDEGPRSLVSPNLLRHARLETVWAKKLPIKKGESLERLFLLGDRLYALSSRNYIVSLDRKKGDFIFSRPLAPAEFKVLGLELYKGEQEQELISIVGNRLVEINPKSGAELRSKRLDFGVSCPVARNSSYFYVGGSDRRLRAFVAEDKVELFDVAAENDSLITSIVADDNSVVLATDTGNVMAIAPDRPRRLWQFIAADGIIGPIVRDERSLFIASRDTYVYKLDLRDGTVPVWKYQTRAILNAAPRVTKNVLYQYVHNKGLTAVDKNSGRFMWEVPNGVELLAEHSPRAYVFKKPGELVVMDNKSNKRLYSVNFAGVSRYTANVADSGIYIADKEGRIACVRPLD
ncbi:MAG: outer membrane protein assembly factor BamB family protein [Planctomycetota bacterium]|jgi:hypothetical protein